MAGTTRAQHHRSRRARVGLQRRPDVELWEEVHAWRQRWRGLLPDQPDSDRASAPSREVERHG